TMAAAATGTIIHVQRSLRVGRSICSMTRARKSARGSTFSISRTVRSIARSTASACRAPSSAICLSMGFVRILNAWAGGAPVPRSRELPFHHPPCLGDTPFECANRDLQHRRDLLVGVFTGPRKQERIPQLWWQRRDQLPDLRLQVGGYQG